MKNGAYKLQLNVGPYIGVGTLTLFGGDGQGNDGKFKIEVHVSGTGHELRGVVNVLLVMEQSRIAQLPAHFSLAVIGSGADDCFDLIGRGPQDLLVELTAEWVAESRLDDPIWLA